MSNRWRWRCKRTGPQPGKMLAHNRKNCDFAMLPPYFFRSQVRSKKLYSRETRAHVDAKKYFPRRFWIYFYTKNFLRKMTLKTLRALFADPSARVGRIFFVKRLFTSEIYKIVSLMSGNDRLMSDLF